LEEEALLPELRGYNKVMHLLELDLRPDVYGEEMPTHSLSSSESSESNLSNDEENHPPHHHPIIYQQICYDI
jgi:hypothetical protein